MTRVANALIIEGVDVSSLSTPGWAPTRENLGSAASFVSDLSLTKDDLVILDLWSNQSYMGSDELGLPAAPYKSAADGKYHIRGA